MVTFNWETYTPYSIGFNETFNRLEALAGGGTNYPPYNIVNGSDGRTTLEVALAGFSREDIEVETERNVLTVSARKAPEDKERIHRFVTLGYKVARVENYIYHLEHSRGPNSWPVSFHGNPHMMENQKLWQLLQGLDKAQLRRYYDSQKYLRKYK